MRDRDAVWQLDSGWDRLEHGARLIKDVNGARLRAQGRQFFVEFRVPETPGLRRRHFLSVELNGEWLGAPMIDKAGHYAADWAAPKGLNGDVQVRFRVDPADWKEGPAILKEVRIERFGFR